MTQAAQSAREPAAGGPGLAAHVAEERRKAAAALLRRPLLLAHGATAESFALVRRHGVALREWFGRHCGWALQIDSELARLRKTPADTHDATRALLDTKEEPFTRRRYVTLCLALAALERSERQIVLRRIAEDVASAFAAEPEFAACGLGFDLSLREHRRDLVEVIRYLIAQGILRRVDGDEQQYIAQQRDVLYNINAAALAAMLNVRRGPSTVSARDLDERIELIVEEPTPDTEDGRNRRIRTRLFRMLVDDPVVYAGQLGEEEQAYLSKQRPFILREIEAATPLVGEVRKEGIAMVDPDESCTDLAMPEEGTDGHLTLLLAERLAQRLRRGQAEGVPFQWVRQESAKLIREHQAHWRKNVTEPGADELLSRQALVRLEALRLASIDWHAEMVAALPAIGRYAVGKVRGEAKAAAAPSLWQQDPT